MGRSIEQIVISDRKCAEKDEKRSERLSETSYAARIAKDRPKTGEKLLIIRMPMSRMANS
jgi:hypothetical protein